MGASVVRWSVTTVAAVAAAAAAIPGPPEPRIVSVSTALLLGAIATAVRPRPAHTERPVPIVVRAPTGDATTATTTVATSCANSEAFTDGHALHVGRAPGGGPLSLDGADGVLVVGRGAFAVGVFVALTAALGATSNADQELRVTVGTDVDLPELPSPAARTLPPGVGVAVLVGIDGGRTGSVVLVPDLRLRPRGRCPTIEVTRYGCTIRKDPDDPAGMALAPVLPALDPPGG